MPSSPPALLFPRAVAYRACGLTRPGAVRESPAPDFAGFPYTERHLKCVWYDSALRPPLLHTHGGEAVVVEQPGAWNLEAGPDFTNAALRIGPDRRRVTGDVEIHVRPADWSAHRHAANPGYAHVCAHLTFFPGALPDAALPAGAVQIALKKDLAANARFSFDAIDLTAYPFAARTAAGPCAAVLGRWDPERIGAFLDAAGEERLRRKAERLRAVVEAIGPEQTLYEDVMGALGYKHNRAPFRLLAERVPVAVLRAESGLDPLIAYALLAGVSGLLPLQMAARWDRETRAWVRRLWDIWWKHQSRWAAQRLERASWRLSGLRPQNHPLRRLMAAACLFCRRVPFAEQVQALASGPFKAWERFLAGVAGAAPADLYWARRLSFNAGRLEQPVALVGERRAAAILSNVLLPFVAARASASGGPALRLPPELLHLLPPEEDNSVVRRTAALLLGPDHNPARYRGGLRQQGLIQVFHDFCLNDRSGCRDCPLPDALRRFQA